MVQKTASYVKSEEDMQNAILVGLTSEAKEKNVKVLQSVTRMSSKGVWTSFEDVITHKMMYNLKDIVTYSVASSEEYATWINFVSVYTRAIGHLYLNLESIADSDANTGYPVLTWSKDELIKHNPRYRKAVNLLNALTSGSAEPCAGDRKRILHSNIELGGLMPLYAQLGTALCAPCAPGSYVEEQLLKTGQMKRWAENCVARYPSLYLHLKNLEDVELSLRTSLECLPGYSTLVGVAACLRVLPLPYSDVLSVLASWAAEIMRLTEQHIFIVHNVWNYGVESDSSDPRYGFYVYEFMKDVLPALRGILLFQSHVNYDWTVQKDPVQSWIDDEVSIRDMVITKEQLSELRNCASRFYRKHPLKVDRCTQFSSGSVADTTAGRGNTVVKCKQKACMTKRSLRSLGELGLDGYWPGEITVGDPVGKLICVPKSWKSLRTITEEPSAQAWLQKLLSQGLSGYLHTATNGWLNPGHDDLNKEMIYDLCNCTGDLTSASDRLRLDVVLACLPPQYRKLLLAARTSQVRLPDGTIWSLSKFSGMGNGTTFPAEEITFFMLIQLAMERHSHVVEKSTVHGDDIVTNCMVWDWVRETLEEFGCIVNDAKSYDHTSAFRESCGLDLYHTDFGVIDCSCQRLSRRFDRAANTLIRRLGKDIGKFPLTDDEKEALMGLVSLATDSYLNGNFTSTGWSQTS